MTLHWMDMIWIVGLVVVGSTASYVMLTRKIRQMVTARNLKIADQLASLDDAIRALETRMAEHHTAAELLDSSHGESSASEEPEIADAEERESVEPDIQAVIAAAAVTALGQDIHIRSMKPATSSWSQQGRVMVQGSHNARARR